LTTSGLLVLERASSGEWEGGKRILHLKEKKKKVDSIDGGRHHHQRGIHWSFNNIPEGGEKRG